MTVQKQYAEITANCCNSLRPLDIGNTQLTYCIAVLADAWNRGDLNATQAMHRIITLTNWQYQKARSAKFIKEIIRYEMRRAMGAMTPGVW